MKVKALIAVLAVAISGALFYWQQNRQALVMACVTRGGTWDGSRSLCVPGRPILMQRGLLRS